LSEGEVQVRIDIGILLQIGAMSRRIAEIEVAVGAAYQENNPRLVRRLLDERADLIGRREEMLMKHIDKEEADGN
jgi:uncharacterized membrane protein (DUF106 family)